MESISMQEMTDFGMDSIPGVIELNDINDEFGMDLLANNRGGGGREVSFGSGAPRDVEVGVRMASEPESVTFDIPLAANDSHFNITRDTEQPLFSNGPDIYSNAQTSSASGVNFTPASLQKTVSEEERKKKREILTKLNRLAERGYEVSQRFTMDNTLTEMEEEYERLCDAKRFTSSLEWQRGALVTFVNGLEMMNDRYDPFDVKLKGWSESVNENIESYDDIFEELYDKYKGRGGMPPEVRLAFKLASSGFMIHASNSIFSKKKESIEESLRRDPVFMQRVAQASMQNMGDGFSSFMNEIGVGGGQQQQQQQQQQFYQQNQPQVARREMRGPPNVDDILNQFDRHSDSHGQPAVASVAAINSLASEEIQSQPETIKTIGGTRKSKKKSSTPVGSVYALHV